MQMHKNIGQRLKGGYQSDTKAAPREFWSDLTLIGTYITFSDARMKTKSVMFQLWTPKQNIEDGGKDTSSYFCHFFSWL